MLDAKFNAVEQRLGFPTKRRHRCLFGPHNSDTLIIERQWESMAVMEATYEKAFADAEWQAVGNETFPLIQSNSYELYSPLP